jgi:hypothetical protein
MAHLFQSLSFPHTRKRIKKSPAKTHKIRVIFGWFALSKKEMKKFDRFLLYVKLDCV